MGLVFLWPCRGFGERSGSGLAVFIWVSSRCSRGSDTRECGIPACTNMCCFCVDACFVRLDSSDCCMAFGILGASPIADRGGALIGLSLMKPQVAAACSWGVLERGWKRAAIAVTRPSLRSS